MPTGINFSNNYPYITYNTTPDVQDMQNNLNSIVGGMNTALGNTIGGMQDTLKNTIAGEPGVIASALGIGQGDLANLLQSIYNPSYNGIFQGGLANWLQSLVNQSTVTPAMQDVWSNPEFVKSAVTNPTNQIGENMVNQVMKALGPYVGKTGQAIASSLQNTSPNSPMADPIIASKLFGPLSSMMNSIYQGAAGGPTAGANAYQNAVNSYLNYQAQQLPGLRLQAALASLQPLEGLGSGLMSSMLSGQNSGLSALMNAYGSGLSGIMGAYGSGLSNILGGYKSGALQNPGQAPSVSTLANQGGALQGGSADQPGGGGGGGQRPSGGSTTNMTPLGYDNQGNPLYTEQQWANALNSGTLQGQGFGGGGGGSSSGGSNGWMSSMFSAPLGPGEQYDSGNGSSSSGSASDGGWMSSFGSAPFSSGEGVQYLNQTTGPGSVYQQSDGTYSNQTYP